MSASILRRPTLVLNRQWQPVQVTPVARALVLVWNETAEVVDPDDYQRYAWSDWARLAPADGQPFVQAVSLRLRAPEVVALVACDRQPPTSVSFSRRNLFKRDHFTCQYCGAQPGSEELTVDHVTPRSQGGASTWENCVVACVSCNSRKADRRPEEIGFYLRRRPARPAWQPLYAFQTHRMASWKKFLSEAYWNVPLET